MVETTNLFQKLCFVIHSDKTDKSKFIPAKRVEHLGFDIDLEKMIIYLSYQKKKFLRNVASFQRNQNGIYSKFLNVQDILKLSSQFIQMLHLKVWVPL